MTQVSPLGVISPTVILAGSWAIVYTLQSVFAPDMVSNLPATLSIVLITLAFASGEMISCRNFNKKIIKNAFLDIARNEESKSAIKLRRLVILFGVLGLLGALQYANALGLFEARSVEELIILPGSAREQIFAGNLDVPLVSRIGFLISYSGVVLALSYYYIFRWRWFLTLPMLAVLLLGVSQSGRAGVMVIILQVIITAFIKNVVILKKSPSHFIFWGLAVPVLFIFLIFFGGQFLREGFDTVDVSDLSRVLYSARGYLFGGVSAYASWFDAIYDPKYLSFGRYSFSSLFSALGLYPQAPGIYDEYLPISRVGETSNVFTAYRSFIDDFSLAGACLFYFIAGIVIGYTCANVKKGRNEFVLLLVPLVSWLAFSPLASLTYFNSFLLSCFLPFYIGRKLVN